MKINNCAGIRFAPPLSSFDTDNYQLITQTVLSEITEDSFTEDLIPASYMLEKIVFENTSANEAILDCGTTSGSNNIFSGQTIAANSITTIVINKMFSTSTDTDLSINDTQVGSAWNSATINITIILGKVG